MVERELEWFVQDGRAGRSKEAGGKEPTRNKLPIPTSHFVY